MLQNKSYNEWISFLPEYEEQIYRQPPGHENRRNLRVISSFRHNVGDICVLLGYYAMWSGNSLPTLMDKLSAPSSGITKIRDFFDFLTLTDGIDRLSRNFSKELSLYMA